jgi:hypothetical protein
MTRTSSCIPNDIIRARNGFEVLEDPEFRSTFYAGLNVLMRELDYQVVACVIDKPALITKYGRNVADPYHYSLHVLIERSCKELGACVDDGIIYTEKRGEPLDYALNVEWEYPRTGIQGTGYADSTMIDERVCELILKEKKCNIPGLQIADLVVSPIARWAMALATKEDWEIVQQKFRRSTCGEIQGYGLVVRHA